MPLMTAGQGNGLCPHSPVMAFGPCRRRPSTTMPPPTPVPRMTPNTTLWPAPAPSTASEMAKQSASLASRTGRPSADSRSRFNRSPMRQVELAFLIKSVVGDTVPGIPTPTGSCLLKPASRSRAVTRSRTAPTVAAYPPLGVEIRWRAHMEPEESRTMPSILVPPRSTPIRICLTHPNT